ncbi:ABC transporter substrate-binding protein [Kaustia mangrovi]|uniref:ABC transporter substrate-binding protein n=1 Tax=Kaustia mangrovi TaxID=2593653 RepID=A0A7S8C3J6_9HYPH|nr:ABC transporter substrate-binding protein [Kaustia mangrovi]QPC42714.1 ABC transporter substrate-binding protein [Kaustia mangrovi]
MINRFLMAATTALALSLTAGAHAQEPRDGGTIRYTAAYGPSFAGLDIHSTNRTQDAIWAMAMHRGLYGWDPVAKKPTLELAESVDVSDDGLVYTYKLRDDAYFHNGRKMTADDIVWTYTDIMDGSKAYPGARYVRLIEGAEDVESGKAKTISGLKKIDDHTLEITLTEPVEPGYYLNQMTTAIYPAKEAQEKGFASHPIGLGPFKFEEYVPGSRMAFSRFDKFYKKDLPHADKLVITPMGEASARNVAFRNQEIDASILGPVQYQTYSADPELSKNMVEVAEYYTRVMGFNPGYEPFADKRVRQAINYAINTDLIIKKLAKGKAYPAAGWLPPSSSAYDKSMKPYAYDPDKAKALLKEAGYADGFEFEVIATSNESWGVPIIEAIVPMLAKVGIKVTIKPVEGSVLSESVRAGKFQAFMWSLETGPDPLAALKCFDSSTPQSACNYTKFDNAEFDKLLEQAGNEKDQAKRIETLQKANKIVYDEAPYWFYNCNKAVMAYQPWLHGLQANPVDLALQNYEDIWVDDSSPVAE